MLVKLKRHKNLPEPRRRDSGRAGTPGRNCPASGERSNIRSVLGTVGEIVMFCVTCLAVLPGGIAAPDKRQVGICSVSAAAEQTLLLTAVCMTSPGTGSSCVQYSERWQHGRAPDCSPCCGATPPLPPPPSPPPPAGPPPRGRRAGDGQLYYIV